MFWLANLNKRDQLGDVDEVGFGEVGYKDVNWFQLAQDSVH
jgi:hypothetical protein